MHLSLKLNPFFCKKLNPFCKMNPLGFCILFVALSQKPPKNRWFFLCPGLCADALCFAYEPSFPADAWLIEETKRGKMYGEWNDYGRLQ